MQLPPLLPLQLWQPQELLVEVLEQPTPLLSNPPRRGRRAVGQARRKLRLLLPRLQQQRLRLHKPLLLLLVSPPPRLVAMSSSCPCPWWLGPMVGMPLPQRQLPLLLPLLRLMPALPLAWRQVRPAASRLGLLVRLLVPGLALVWVWVVVLVRALAPVPVLQRVTAMGPGLGLVRVLVTGWEVWVCFPLNPRHTDCRPCRGLVPQGMASSWCHKVP